MCFAFFRPARRHSRCSHWSADGCSASDGRPARIQPSGLGPLRDLHFKDVGVPGRFCGGAQNWVEWSTAFRRFLGARDPHFDRVLNPFERLKGKPVTPEHEAA